MECLHFWNFLIIFLNPWYVLLVATMYCYFNKMLYLKLFAAVENFLNYLLGLSPYLLLHLSIWNFELNWVFPFPTFSSFDLIVYFTRASLCRTCGRTFPVQILLERFSFYISSHPFFPVYCGFPGVSYIYNSVETRFYLFIHPIFNI